MSTEVDNILYCNSLYRYERWLTREVAIGGVPLGAHHPIRIQSMTTTDSMDTAATVAQSIRMIEAGCEYVRITAPSIREAENLAAIKQALKQQGYNTPLIADIHFTPNAAEAAARIVEKVRVNPGNYADKKKFEIKEYTDAAYDAELHRIRHRFLPLIRVCKEYGTAMRIGTNHGSLSDRIMNRYGDTPLGMVESAMEFLRICEDENYHSIVLSMKASNPLVMVQAYRLLVIKMKEAGMNYPLHLGVTEAGDGEDGRIKSAAGIGTLLEDGLGDTIRVSLTEEPEFEIPVARSLLRRYVNRSALQSPIAEPGNTVRLAAAAHYASTSYARQATRAVMNLGGTQAPRIVADFSRNPQPFPACLERVGYRYLPETDKWRIHDQATDFVYTGENAVDLEIPGTLGIIYDYRTWLANGKKPGRYPFFRFDEYMATSARSTVMNFVAVGIDDVMRMKAENITPETATVMVFDTGNAHAMPELRRMFFEWSEHSLQPALVRRAFPAVKADELAIDAAADLSGLLLDGFGDGIWIDAPGIDAALLNRTAFGILQATRTRISKTEYISCPSCGRTLFDLQETTALIRARTAHLKGVKIGIMGCIVNGPGEMADADYGYVGTGIGKITLYKGREVIKKNIPAAQAVEALVELIREHGDWVEEQ